ncbi:TPA: hypothetical protein P0V47_003128 [Listeria innocua]|nr:hypothetical protein [Listeria innocua]HDM8995817.1 hypothetical protein [Listeria innocua]
MDFSLLENGIDSIKQAKFNIDENYLNHEFESFQLKDGLFNFVHGMEILSKFIISNHCEEKIFRNKRRYFKAKENAESSGKSIFDEDPDLRTITGKEALDILKSEFEMSESLHEKTYNLVGKRDALMHHTVNLHDKEHFVNQLRTCIDLIVKYFEEQITEFESAYKEFERNYPYTEYDRYEDDAINAAEASHEDIRLGIE